MKWIFAIFVLYLSFSLTGCSVFAVADAVVTTGATVVSTGAKAIGATVEAVIPDSKPKN